MNPTAGVKIWQVDAFSQQPFAGNPAAVCILKAYPSDVWMQQVAAEMNLAETAFVVPTSETNNYQIRWFTPAVEVDLCGHATLAAVHVLYEQGQATSGLPIRFVSRSGHLLCTRQEAIITLDFPATPPETVQDEQLTAQTMRALGLPAGKLLRSRFDLLVVVNEEAIVRTAAPNFNALAEIDVRGVILTAPSNEPGIAFVSRFFAPRCGINEDPVTGSAHCCLAPYWAERLGELQLTGYQASQWGGQISCQVTSDRVKLSGSAVTVLEGKLLVEPV